MPLGKQTQPRLAHKDIICVHTMVGYLKSTNEMFRKGGYTGTESHVGIGGIWGSDKDAGLDGKVWQFQDSDYTADANYKGAWHVLSIETADNAPQWPKDIAKWTPKQVDAIVKVCTEWCIQYNIPPVLIPDTKPNRRGLAYHAQGCSPHVVSGGEAWSLSAGKECPGPVRIKQFKEEVIPKVARAVQAIKHPPTKVEEAIMALTDVEIDRIWNKTNNITKQAPAGSLHEVDLRTEGPNLQLQVSEGIKKALTDSTHPLTVRLTSIEAKLDQVIANTTPKE
jgi:N-acetylmuramoyl-L-alanine amidase